MKSINPQFLIWAFIIITGVVGYQYYQHNYTPVSLPGLPEPKPNERRPDFTLPNITGQMHSNAEWDGKVVVVNFWATWCQSCRKEIPVFIKLQNEYAEQGVQFIGIAVRDDTESVKRFAKDMGINYPLLIDKQKNFILSKTFGNTIGALPFTVVVDRKGNIVSRFAGEMNERAAKKTFVPFLGT